MYGLDDLGSVTPAPMDKPLLVWGIIVICEYVPGRGRSTRVGQWAPGWLGDTGPVHSAPLEIEVYSMVSAAYGSDSHDSHC